ncbi:MAG: serine/threonine phosphatase [Xenococcus sp. (in: cyanobacteria)]
MLICPECKYENSEHNKFCENCGTSLTSKNCHKCGAEIDYAATECDSCGAFVATKLLAIISEVAETKSQKSLTQDCDDYLDTKKRYYLLEKKPLLSEIDDAGRNIIYRQIIDKFPLQESSLYLLRKTKTELFAELDKKLEQNYQTGVTSTSEATKEEGSLGDESLSEDVYLRMSESLSNILPAQALPYLLLEDNTSIIPSIRDAWQEKNYEVIIIQDRSNWQSLTELWSKPQWPLLQVLWSLGAMAKLWTRLSQSHCVTSLLVQSNLKVDEDQSFCLERLYADPQEKQPTLSDLAVNWYNWLNDSGQTYPEDLISVLQQTISGEIQEIETLLDKLHQIVDLQEIRLDSNSQHDESWSNAMEPEPWQNFDDDEETDFFKVDSNEDSMIYDSDADEQPTAMFLMQVASVSHASYTDIGSSRDHNEDFFGAQTNITQKDNPSEQKLDAKGLYIICDGMGGHAAGEVASAMGVETLQNYFYTYWEDKLPSEQTIEEGILLANQVIYQTNIDNSRSGHGRMGTTLVMALLQNTQLAIAHVGDSRIYRITRTGGLEQLTVDHEVGQREINRGVEPEIAYGRPDAYQLTQALGPRDKKNLRPSIQYFDLEKDCLILLCSDGLSDNDFLEKHWQTHLLPLLSFSADLNSGLCALMTFADRYNGHDNLTAILIRIKLKPEE